MVTLIRQELFKLGKKRSTWISTLILILIQIGVAFIAKKYPGTFTPEMVLENGFMGFPLIFFYMVAACSSIITMEFQYNTVKEVLYRKYSRGQVLVSKWLTMFLYSIYWLFLTYFITYLLKLVFFNDFDLMRKISHHQTFLISQSQYIGATFINYWLLLTLVLLLANLFKNSAVATSVGIIGYFLLSIVMDIVMIFIDKWEWLK